MNSHERAVGDECDYQKWRQALGEHGALVSRRQFLETTAGAPIFSGFPSAFNKAFE